MKMNRIYKVIWSKVRNCYVVVSELAKRNGKDTTSTDKRRKLTAGLAMAAMAVVLNMGVVGSAEADSMVIGGKSATSSDNSIAVGNYATTIRPFTTAEAQVKAYNALQQTIKNNNTLRNVTAVQNATTYDDLIASLTNVLNSASSTASAKTAANNYITQLNDVVSILQANTANYPYTADNAIAIGNNATAANTNAIAVGAGGTISRQVRLPGSTNSISTSTPTGAYGSYDIAIGKAAAYGNRTSATTGNFTNDDTDIGGYYSTTGGAGGAIAVGYDALAVRQYTIAVGTQSMAAGQYAVAVGANARALTPYSVAIGGGPAGQQGIQGRGAINTPLDSPVQGGSSITIGNANNFTYGYVNTDDYYANTKNSIAIGYHAHTHAANAFAIGISTDATAERSFAIGTASTSHNDTASHQGARAGGQGSIAFGDTALVRGDVLPSDATKGLAEDRATYTSTNDAIAIGTNTLTQARNAVTLGGGMSYTYHQYGTDDDGNEDKTKITNITQYYDGSGWVDDRAEGSGAKVGLKADGAIAIGGATGTVEGINSEYFPTNALSGKIDDYTAAASIGDNATRAVAIGSGSSASVANGIALGAYSVAARASSNGGAGAGYDATTGKNYAGKDADAPTWTSTLAAVSIGGDSSNAAIGQAATETRQLTGVAAGSADTDAVNVAQLKRVASSVDAVNLKFNANAGGVKSNASGSTVSVVGTAAKSGHTYSAENVTTEITQDDSGNSTITVKMDENPSFTSVTTGNTKIDNNGLTISNGPSVTKTNVSMGGNQIHNVAAGSSGNDAVNLNQLNKTAEQLQWRIGITDGGGTNGAKDEDGAFTKALEPSLVGNVDGVDRSNVQFIAGAGIDISHSELKDENGYGVKISSKFEDLKPTIEGGHFAGSITYDGHEYFLTGGGASVVDVISDKRAAIAEAVTKESEDADGNTVYNHAIEIFTPYIEISGTEDAKESDFAKTNGANAIAVGYQSKALAENTIAVGNDAKSNAEASTAIGYNSRSDGAGSVAIGVASSAAGNRAIAIGTTARNNEDNPEYETSNPYQGARAAGQGSIVLGDRARALSQGNWTDDEKIGVTDTATNDAIAIGTHSEVRARNAIAMGGNMSYSYVDKETGQIMTVYGNTDGRQVGAVVGDDAYSGIAIGGAYGTVTVDENGDFVSLNREIDAAATYGVRGIAIGSGALVANPDDFQSLQKALSDKTYISYKKAFEEARSNYTAALSAWNAIKDITPNDPDVPSSMRVTKEEKAAAEALYTSTKAAMEKATANYSMALKEVVRLQQKDSVLESDAIAIGTQANASIQDSIALGSNSVTDANDKSGYRTGISGYDPLSETSDNDHFRGGTVGGTEYEEDDPVWRSTAGSLSVGGGTTTVTNSDGEEVTVTVTRRISNVAAGVNDSDAVNVAQLKRATTFSTDSRNTTIGVDEEGNMSISSPYLNIKGVGASAEHTSIIKQYKNAEAYKSALDSEAEEIQGRIDSINKTRSIITDNLTQLEADYGSNKISESDYTAQKLEYNDQLNATALRLENLEASLNEIKAKSANAEAVFAEAKSYYDSQANASGTDSIAIGNKAASGGKDSISIGQNNQIGTVGELDADTDTDLEKEGANSIAIGKDNKITGTKNSDSSTDSIAIGSGNTVINKESLALGKDNTVSGERSIAIGTGNEVYGDGSGAIGDPTIIKADNSYSVGNNNKIGGENDETKVKLDNVFILGNKTSVDANNTIVLGSDVTIAKDVPEGSVFIGNQSGYVAKGNRSAADRTDYTGDTFNGKTYNYAGGDQTAGVVSVGNGTQTRRIQNVAPGLVGPESTDAINGSQLHSAIMNAEQNMNNVANNLGNQISNVENRTKKGLAGAAALAALHPLDFDPDDKLTFAAGMGHYRGENAAALGLFYRPDEKVMFSVGGTMGNGENMINAGVSFSLDRTPRVTGSRTALTKEVVALREHVARQDARLAKQDAQIEKLTALVLKLAGNGSPEALADTAALLKDSPALFPDTLENRWVYDSIEDLEQRGYIHGYAGRELTRDELAAALDRAMAGGAKLEERIVKEFEPELSHVRVAHVEGKGNYEGEWYERPRASHDKLEDKHKIEKKPFRVEEKKITSKS